ncbi:MAG: pyrrolidone-carboxylate peptidase [Planctomycetota bacterium]|jgi:pyrrolidone-carboxylate peptidase
MREAQILLTGFGSFLDVEANPSAEVAQALNGEVLNGTRVRSVVLPVAFLRLRAAYTEALLSHASGEFTALLSMGVHRGSQFRLERRARPHLSSEKPDVDGVYAAQLEPLGAEELSTGLDLEKLSDALRSSGASEVSVSDDAGGYVCERCCYEVLSQSRRLQIPGLFLHVPPSNLVAVPDQLAPVRALIEEIVRQANLAQ